MSSESSNLLQLARSKLHLSVGSKDNCSLHRWVLLKNFIIQSPSPTSSTASNNLSDPYLTPTYPIEDDDDDEDDDAEEDLDFDSFMFPDGGQLVTGQTPDVKSSEAQWLDSLLETLGDDDEDEFGVDSDTNISPLPTEDDDDQLFSPTASPMSSSDDLPNQPTYYLPPIPVSYPVPYPPFHPPLVHNYDFDSTFDSPLSSLPPPFENSLPYRYMDDIEDLTVPDAIEDTSDDESDTPPTPLLGRSSSSLSPIDAASIPLPTERSRLRYNVPHVYVDSHDSYFSHFELDPLPFPDEHHPSYNHFQEC